MAVIEATSAHPPFFNISQAKLSVGSVTFLPSPGRKTLKSFRKDNSKLSPRAQVFKEILETAKELKADIDVSKTAAELEFEKTIEREIVKDEENFMESRKEYLSS
jgi:CRISPR/Cas system-associated protein Cas10 (large subunit of type III CRISPR-Cas system)